jgi:hypothetical protein
MKTLLIYDDLVSLNREAHRELKLKPAADKFGFARETNSVLIAASELPQAALDFPCVFVSTETGVGLAAILGLQAHENLFVQPDGAWRQGAYLPAFIRRYPFVLAESEGDSNFTVCLDRAYAGLNTQDGQALFEADGRETQWLEEIKQFLVAFRQEMVASRDLGQRLADLDLLEDRVIEYELMGERQTLRGFKTVNEAKLRSLPAEALEGLSAQGLLGLIYAHLLSLNQVQRLAVKLDERRSQAAAERESAAAVH